MRCFIAYFAHESNSFSPLPTSVENFREDVFHVPGQSPEPLDPTGLPDDLALIRLAQASGHDVVVGPLFGATPSAPANRVDYESLRDTLLEQLARALPVDAVLLFLHGAQLARGYDDCGGDVLTRVRELVGPTVPVGVELDLHCNISPAMLDAATILVACKEYPHTDFADEAARLIDLAAGAVRGDLQPTMAFRPVPMLGFFHTTREPMRGFVNDLRSLEQQASVLSVSLCHGFGLADTPFNHAGVLAVTDADRQRAETIAEELARRFFRLREEIRAPAMPVDRALDAALARGTGTVVIADTTDNAGGGAAADSTFLLRALLDREVENAALGLLYDPMAVDFAMKAGVGATLPLRIGGKTGPLSGDPLDVEARVTALRDDARQSMFGAPSALGRAAAVRIAGVDVVLNSARQQTFDPACFTELGIDPWSRRIVVVKSAQHFWAAFAPFATEII